MCVRVCVCVRVRVCVRVSDLRVESGSPSRRHSTMRVEEGGGLTLQGSTAVWPTRASTRDGSDGSMVTPPPRVRLGEEGGEERRGR